MIASQTVMNIKISKKSNHFYWSLKNFSIVATYNFSEAQIIMINCLSLFHIYPFIPSLIF